MGPARKSEVRTLFGSGSRNNAPIDPERKPQPNRDGGEAHGIACPDRPGPSLGQRDHQPRYNPRSVKIYTSAWVVPVSSPPIREGAVAIDGDTIVTVGSAQTALAAYAQTRSAVVEDLGDSVILPAFVNAHTHLELSGMAHEGLPRGDFMAWARAMIGRRKRAPNDVVASIRGAIDAIRASGTGLVGDVGNTLAALPLLHGSGLPGRFFLELIGARAENAAKIFEDGERTLGTLRASLVPHSPLTVSTGLLVRLAARARERDDVVSVHLAESRAEAELLERGEGPFRTLLEEIGAIGPDWAPPRLSPARVLDAAGLLGPRTIAVHGVHLSPEDARLLAARGTSVVLCPRSNARLGVGAAPVGMLLEEGVHLALGTDSLASNDDLDVFAELAALRQMAGAVPPEALLRAATLGGAEALGFGAELGSIEPGKRAALVALRRKSQGGGGDDRPSFMKAQEGAAVSIGEPYAKIFAGPGLVSVTVLGPGPS